MTNLSYGDDNADNPLVFTIRLEQVLSLVNERRAARGERPIHIEHVDGHVDRIQKDLALHLGDAASEAVEVISGDVDAWLRE